MEESKGMPPPYEAAQWGVEFHYQCVWEGARIYVGTLRVRCASTDTEWNELLRYHLNPISTAMGTSSSSLSGCSVGLPCSGYLLWTHIPGEEQVDHLEHLVGKWYPNERVLSLKPTTKTTYRLVGVPTFTMTYKIRFTTDYLSGMALTQKSDGSSSRRTPMQLTAMHLVDPHSKTGDKALCAVEHQETTRRLSFIAEWIQPWHAILRYLPVGVKK